MAACSPATSRPMGRGPASQPSTSNSFVQRPWNDDSHKGGKSNGSRRKPECHVVASRCALAAPPSRERLVGPPTVSRRASDWTPPRAQGPKVRWSLDLRPSSGQGSPTKGACLMRGQFAPKLHHHPAAPTLWALGGRSSAVQFRHVHASAASHPRRRFPRLPQIMGSQSSCQFKSPHHRPPLIVQCVPVWQWIASWGKRRTPRGPLLSAIRLTLSRPGGRWLPGCRRHIDPMSNEIWNVGVRFCDLSRLDIGDRDAQLQPLRRASLWSFVS